MFASCPEQRPPGIMSVLDDICFQMHGQSEGADVKLLEVLYLFVMSNIPSIPYRGIDYQCR